MVCIIMYVLGDKDFKYKIVGLLRHSLGPPFLKMVVINTNVTISQTLHYIGNCN